MTVEETEAILAAALKVKDELAVIECLASAVLCWPNLGDAVIAKVFLPALNWLTERRDTRWVRGVWFLPQLTDLLCRFDAARAQLVLANLLHAVKIDYNVERILTIIAPLHVGLVWAYFRDRLLIREDADAGSYEAVPYQLHGLPLALAADPLSAIRKLRKWFKAGDNMFQFTGGRLLHSTFPQCTPELAAAILEVCKAWTSEDVDFALHALHNYSGEPTIHDVMKAIVRAVAEDDGRLGRVTILAENTGGVWGEYGMVDALRERKALIKEWLKNEDPKVRGFAQRTIRHLDNRIATETRDADMRKEKRKRDTE